MLERVATRRRGSSMGSRVATMAGVAPLVLAVACSSGHSPAKTAASTSSAPPLTTTTVPVTTAVPFTAAPSSTATSTIDANIKVYGDCKTPSIEPTEVVLACADLGAVLQGLSWTSWTSTTATAVGTLVYNDCTPDCARGQHHSVPGTRVTLSAPVRGSQGQLVYSEVQESPQPPGYATGPYHGGPQPLPTQPD